MIPRSCLCHVMDLTFDLRSDVVLRPIGGEDHCSQVSPSGVSTQVQAADVSKGLVRISEREMMCDVFREVPKQQQ